MTLIKQHKIKFTIATIMLTLFAIGVFSSESVANAFGDKVEGNVKVNPVDLRTGPDWPYDVIGTAQANANVRITGVNQHRTWYFISSDAGDGWVEASTVQPWRGLENVSVWEKPMRGAAYQPSGTFTCDEAIRTGPEWGYTRFSNLGFNSHVKVIGINSNYQWLFVETAAGQGWVPFHCVNHNADNSKLPMWDTPMAGAAYKPDGSMNRSVDILGGPDWNYNRITTIPANQYLVVLGKSTNGQWLFIWSDIADGWVPADSVRHNAVLHLIPMWDTPMQGAYRTDPQPVETNSGAGQPCPATGAWPQGCIPTATSGSGQTASSDPSTTTTPEPTVTISGKVLAYYLNVRRGPSTDYGVITAIPYNTHVNVVARNADSSWVFVTTELGNGWVSCAWLNLHGADTSVLPIWASP